MNASDTVLSCMSANFIARELDYSMTEGWGQGSAALEAHFRPAATFPERFDALCAEIAAMGFSAIDLYLEHLNPAWATADHVKAAMQALDRHNLQVMSLAGGMGNDRQGVVDTIGIAKAFGAEVLGGGSGLFKSDRAAFVDLMREHHMRFAFENHPAEKTADDVKAIIGDDDADVIGVAVDTGWFATNGFPPADAIRALGDRVFLVHMKDIFAPDTSNPGKTLKSVGHETCALGNGVADIPACVTALREIGYTGSISIEHEPEDHNPTEDLKASLAYMKELLG